MNGMTRAPRAGAVAGALVGLGLTGLVAVTVVSVWTRLGQRGDEAGRWAAGVPYGTRRLLSGWLGLVSVGIIAVVLAVAVLVALARRRSSRALGAIALIAGANISTQLLKATIPRPSYGIGIGTGNTLPSGHVTVVTSLVLAAVLVLPQRHRRTVALLAAGAGTLTAAATMIQRWHRPSDVLAAYAVCAVWAGIALFLANRWSPRHLPDDRTAAIPVRGASPAPRGSGTSPRAWWAPRSRGSSSCSAGSSRRAARAARSSGA